MKTVSALKPKQAYLIANGDLRLSANQKCWPEQAKMEATLARAFAAEGWKIVRAHPLQPDQETRVHRFAEDGHGGLSTDRSAGAADRGGIGLAVQPACSARACLLTAGRF